VAAFAVYLYIFNEYLRPGEVIQSLQGAPVMDYIAIFTIGNWAIYIAQKKGFPRMPQNWLMLGLIASIGIGHFRHSRFAMAFTHMADFCKIALYYFWLVSIMDHTSKISKCVWIIILFSTLLAYHAHLQVTTEVGLFGVEAQREGQPPREVEILPTWKGSFADSNDVGCALVFAVGLCLGYIMGVPNMFGKVLALACIIALSYGAWITTSRGARLSLCVTFASYVGFTQIIPRIGLKQAIRIGAPMAFLGMLVVGPKILDAGDESAQTRLLLWQKGLDMLSSNPIVGKGFKFFTHYSVRRLVAHNSFVHIFGELGLLGYFFWMAMIYMSFREAFKIQALKVRSRYMRTVKGLNLALMCALAGFLSAAYFLTRPYWELLYIMFGLSAAIRTIVPRDILPRPTFKKRDAMNVIALELASVLFVKVSTMAGWSTV
jgi:hypothetical protein